MQRSIDDDQYMSISLADELKNQRHLSPLQGQCPRKISTINKCCFVHVFICVDLPLRQCWLTKHDGAAFGTLQR